MNNLPEPERGCLRVFPGSTQVEADLFAEETDGAEVTMCPWSAHSEGRIPCFLGSWK